MRTKRVSVLIFFSFVIMLTLATLPTVKADEIHCTWDSATHGTRIYAPLGQVGSEAKAYADATGLLKVYTYGGLGLTGIVEAWGELYTTLNGQGRWIKPTITYEVKGGILNCGVGTITLTVIDRETGETVGEWSKNLPLPFNTPVTETLAGAFFEATSDREYLYWVKAYASAQITVVGNCLVDYEGSSVWVNDGYVNVMQLYIKYNPTLNIQTTSGGTTNPAPNTYTYDYGESVTVTATQHLHYLFCYWVLDGENHFGNPITITMNSDHTLKAYFLHTSPGGGGGGGGNYPR